MLCTLLIAVGMGMGSGCIELPPQRDHAAEVLIEQQARENAEFEEMKAKRNKLYHGLRECPECGKMNTLPFQRKE